MKKTFNHTCLLNGIQNFICFVFCSLQVLIGFHPKANGKVVRVEGRIISVKDARISIQALFTQMQREITETQQSEHLFKEVNSSTIITVFIMVVSMIIMLVLCCHDGQGF